MVDTVAEGGGALTEADLDAYRVIRRRPVRAIVARSFISPRIRPRPPAAF